MNEIKLEVGQVWMSINYEFEVLKIWDNKVAYYSQLSDNVNECSIASFRDDDPKLITNADGTPYGKL